MLDDRIRKAVEVAVAETGQKASLSAKLTAWLESLVDGNANLEDRDETRRHLELLYEDVVVTSANGEK